MEIAPEEEQFQFKPEQGEPASRVPLSHSIKSDAPHIPKQHYSTYSRSNSHMHLHCSFKTSFVSSLHSRRQFSTSSCMQAITAEELAMLAKVRQTRRNKNITYKKHGFRDITKMQDKLTSEAQETKVPTSRLGRLASFGSKPNNIRL